MSVRVLAVNAGSSSLKLSILERDGTTVLDEVLRAPDGHVDARELLGVLSGAPHFDAVGHRIVHGGNGQRPAVLIDDSAIQRLRATARLAPLHTAPALRVVDVARGACPSLPHVACFDDGFHATLSEAARAYPVPWDWGDRLGMRRRGFHGLSHAYAARRASQLLHRPASELRVVICHLGAGASAAAVAGGVSVDTTMGATPNEGLVMATRSGSVDPGALLWVQEQEALSPAAMREALERRSGLYGLSGFSSRMEVVTAAADAGLTRARLAIDVYVHRLRAGIAAMAAAMNGLDALVFTGGVGERSARVREATCLGLEFLGVSLDRASNLAAEPDADLSAPGATVRTLVVRCREDLEIAAVTRATVDAAAPRTSEVAHV